MRGRQRKTNTLSNDDSGGGVNSRDNSDRSASGGRRQKPDIASSPFRRNNNTSSGGFWRDSGQVANQVGLNQVGLTAKDETWSEFSPGVMLGLVVGACLSALVLTIVLLSLVVRRCGKSRDARANSLDGREELQTITTSRSAPSTRSSSPQIEKKLTSSGSFYSKQQALGAGGGAGGKGTLVRSVTMDMIPDFTLPPERIQPYQPGEERNLDDLLNFQHNLIGHLQPDLYSASSGPSFDEEDFERPTPSIGSIWFTIIYDAAVEKLVVTLIKAKNLIGRGRGNTPRDPFVKLYLLPDERTCLKSRVVKRTLAPKFNESFTFNVGENEVGRCTLRMSVYDVDKRRVRHTLGHVFVQLKSVDLMEEEVICRPLELNSKSAAALGEINICLTFNPSTEKLVVTVLNGRNLAKLDFDKNEGLYARVQLLHGQKVHKTKRTSAHACAFDPAFNESFSFGLPCRQLESCSIRVALMVTSHMVLSNRDHEYGRVAIGSYMYARGEELIHWQEMVASRQAVARWHLLSSK